MNEKDLFNALNELDDSILESSDEYKNYGKKKAWIKWMTVVACLAVVTLAVYELLHAGSIRDDGSKNNAAPPQNTELSGRYN